MKKTMRVLAVILTLCLLVGAAAIVSSAATVSQLNASQYGGGITNLHLNESGFSLGATGGDAFGAYTKQSVTVDGNTYMKFTRDTSKLSYEVMNTAKYLEKSHMEYEFKNGNAGNFVTKAAISSYDYIVWSLDFMSDSVGENGKLSYLDESWFGSFGNTYYYNYIVKDAEGDWYMSLDAEYSENDAPLATEPGVWNNLTVVISKATSSIYSFANGRHFGTKTGAGAYAIDRIVFNIWDSYDIYNPDWSISVDNVSANAYPASYASASGFGLDDYFADLDLSTYISVCDDIVYNSNYKMPSKAIEYTVVKDGVETKYTNHSTVKSLLSELKAGDSVTAPLKLDNVLSALGVEYARAESGYLYEYVIKDSSASANPEIVEGTLTYFTQAGTYCTFSEYIYEERGASFSLAAALKKNFFEMRSGKEYSGKVSNTHYNMYLGPAGHTDSKSFPTSTDYKYVTMDFDLAAAGYIYLPDGNTDGIYRYTGTLSGLTEAELATAKLSYYEGAGIEILSSGWDFVWNYVSHEGKWYLSLGDKVYSEDDTPLSDIAGEWNHVTFINELATGKLLVYMNGEHVATGKLGAKQFQRISFLLANGIGYSEHDIRIGNLDIDFYTKNYTSGDNVFGLDDYLALGDDMTKYDISFVEDSTLGINDKDYGVPSGVKVVRGEQTLYFKSIADALLGVKNGDTVYYDGDLKLFRSINQELESLNVVATSVVLEGEATALHDYVDGAIKRRSIYTATWLDENGETVKVELVALGSVPNVEALSFNTSIKGNYNQTGAWKWALKGEDTYDALSALNDIAAGSEIVLVPDIVSVGWFDIRNNLLASERWFAGSVASRDFSELGELEVLDNGWYELSYFWNSSKEDMTLKSGVSRTFSPVIEPVDAFTGLKYNFTLGAYFYINHYVPVPDEDIGVVVTGAKFIDNCNTAKLSASKPYFNDLSECTSKAMSLKVGKTVSIGDADYYKFENGAGISAYAWYSPQGFEVCYTVEFEDETYELSSKVALTRLGTKASDNSYVNSYIYTVMSNTECGSEEKTLVVNLARYMSQSYAMQGSLITFSDVDTILKSHKSCACAKSLESYMPTEAPATDASGLAISKGFGAGFRTNQLISTLSIYVPKEYADANPDLEIKADIEGAIVNGATRLETLTVGFSAIMASETERLVMTNDGVACYVYVPRYADNAAYNADLVYSITISAGGNEYKGTYSLSTYLYSLNRSLGLYVYNEETGAYAQSSAITSLTVDHRAIQTLLAQRAYAEAARNYKLN